VTSIELHLGPLKATGNNIFRSGIRWLAKDGQHVEPNEVFAYCNISLEATGARLTGRRPFEDELELQVGFASRVGGHLSISSSASRGGYLSVRGVEVWNPQDVIATIKPDAASDTGEDASKLRLLMLAGRRMTALADVHAGLLPGWHGRSRGWWCDEGETPVTLLSLGICDATGVVVGEQCAFFEMFAAAPMAAQMVFVPDHPITPAAQALMDQFGRTPAEFDAISADLRSYFARSATAPSADDLMFAGAMLSVMQRSPLQDGYDIFSADGSSRLGPADAVLLSLNSEPSSILRHRKLGYHLHVMRHHQAAAGPAIRAWLTEAFESVRRSIADIKRDYETLIDKIGRSTGSRIIILNRMSTSGYEDIASYAAFDPPMSNTLANVASKELNLMLEDIADKRELYIVDVDGIAADIGGGEHLPDGIHQSGEMQVLLRQEILRALVDIKDAGSTEARRQKVR
jgi:hypothetical protein